MLRDLFVVSCCVLGPKVYLSWEVRAGRGGGGGGRGGGGGGGEMLRLPPPSTLLFFCFFLLRRPRPPGPLASWSIALIAIPFNPSLTFEMYQCMKTIPTNIPLCAISWLMRILCSVIHMHIYIYNQMKGASLYQNSSNQECCKYGARNVLLSVSNDGFNRAGGWRGTAPQFAPKRIRTTLPYCKHGDDLSFYCRHGWLQQNRWVGGEQPPPICKQNHPHTHPLLQTW